MRNVRPSWLTISVDGRKSCIETGPRSRQGPMSITAKVRSKGSPITILDIDFLPSTDGSKTLVRITDLRTNQAIFEETFTQ